MMKHMLLRDVARLLKLKPYQITYASRSDWWRSRRCG